ncbi:MAG: 8-oxo-dGTP diphosphatase [Firmicutes bacterium]|nr:8-oxo-dGTP diphosphatase [Bacillota bacterium]
MDRTEHVELAVLCLVYNENAYLLQDKVSEVWKGYTLPGGHIEPGESITNAVIREVKEETGLTIFAPKLRGIKQFPIANGRYIVFLFSADQFEGELTSSEEGNMYWIPKDQLHTVNLVEDFNELLQVILDDNLIEFQYVGQDNNWKVLLH